MRRLLGCARARAPGLAWAVAAELAWHLLGPAWAFAVLFAALYWLAGTLPAAVAASAKAFAVEDRLNALIPKIPSPQARPGNASNTSGLASDNSYGMGGGTNVTWGSGANNGGSNSQTSGVVGGNTYTGGADNSGVTSGQIGSANPHYHDMHHAHGYQHDHDMTHWHTSSSDLQNVFNSLQNSHAAAVATLNGLRTSHSTLIASHNNLLDVLANSRLLR